MDREAAWSEVQKGAALSQAYGCSITSANPCGFTVNRLTADEIQALLDLDMCCVM